MISETSSSVRRTARNPFLVLLLAKISANEEEITARNPKSATAHTACSPGDPQPRFSRPHNAGYAKQSRDSFSHPRQIASHKTKTAQSPCAQSASKTV